MTGTLVDAPAPPRPARAAPRHRARSRALPEAAGIAAALAFALIAVAHLALTDRAWLLFSDADSVLPALLRASLAVGERQDWALSSVLFAPEFALYTALAALGLGVRGTLAANAVANLVLFYAAVRVMTALVRPRATRVAQVAGAVLTTAVFDGLTLLDSSRAWDSLELPSLLATTTYYSATLLATVLAVGLTASLLDPGRRGRAPAAALLVLTAFSSWTNPLFLAWAVLPLALLCAAAAGLRAVPLRVAVRAAGPLAAGSVLGLAARVPFAALLVRDPLDYARPDGALLTVGYWVRLAVDRAATSAGIASLLAAAALGVGAAALTVRWWRAGRVSAALVAAFAWLAPVAALLGTVALGAPASRYLQPAYFAPILLLALIPLPSPPLVLRAPWVRRGAAAALAVAALVSAVAIGVVAARPDPSISCVTAWVTASGRTGAGLFQTIRGPKAALPDPRRLIQVSEDLRAQPWLTDRADYDVRGVSFLVTDR
ncbi:MAG: hypothetical protein QOC59_1195, partial [Microbacteriaceae bacterium]|nr:hypothetical protein [Microbacteriaceae bacterium]